MTMSGRSFCAAACWSLVSKSSKSAVTVAGVPVAAVKPAAIAFAVFSELEPGGLRIQMSSAALASCSGAPSSPQAVSPVATSIVATTVASSLLVDMGMPPVYICGSVSSLWKASTHKLAFGTMAVNSPETIDRDGG
jgi:hypothetical protein